MILRALFALWTSVARTMADHLWQSTLFVALAALLAFALRKNQARVRYWVWLTASVKFLVPLSLLIALGSHFARPRVSTPAQAVVYSAVEDFSQPFVGQTMPLISQAPTPVRVSLLSMLPAMMTGVWLVGIVFVLLRWITGWVRISLMVRRAALVGEGPEVDALRRLESSLGVRRPIRLVLSPDWMEPGIFGIWRPILIWPEGISQHLDERNVEAILAHEVCHARRRDNMTAALHMLVEALFWLHPLVWWMGARLEAERERACDEEVGLLCNEPQVYAESILKVCKFCSESPLACVSGITGADLKKRIVQIMTDRVARNLDFGRKLLLLAVGLGVVAVPIVLAQAKAAQRMMVQAMAAAPKPLREVAHAMIAVEQTSSTQEIGNQAVAPQDRTASDAAIAAATTGPGFEVASIRPSANDNGSMGVDVTPSGRVRILRETVQSLVYYSYLPHVGTGLVQGGPDWTSKQEYDINAQVGETEAATWVKLSDAQRRDRVRLMLRRLLAERFKVKMHSEMQVRPVFALVQAKGGAKLKAVEAPPLNADQEAVEAWEKSENWTAENAPPGTFLMTGSTWTGRALPIGQLLSEIALNAHVDLLVVDETGLKGTYDFTFKPSYDKDAPILLDQIEDQLGLRLEPKKLPVKVYVVDSAEKPSVDGAEVVPAVASVVPVAMVQQNTSNSSQPSISWDVISVKPNHTDTSHPGSMLRPDGFDAENISLLWVMWYAYGFGSDRNPNHFAGLPGWVASERYDIIGKVAEKDVNMWRYFTEAQREQMVRTLIEDRFNMKAHSEANSRPIYALVAGASAPNLEVVEPAKSGDSFMEPHAPGWEIGHAATMRMLADYLSTIGLERPVQDETGLTGHYNFALKYSPTQVAASSNGEAAAPEQDTYPFVFTALQEQLGLKLVPGKGAVEVIVIDHIERPSEN